MESLVSIFFAFAELVLTVTFHAAVFLFFLVSAAFSPRYREKLRNEWNTSGRNRFGMVLGATIHVTFLVIALFFWIPLLLSDDGRPHRQERETVRFTQEEADRLRKTTDFRSLEEAAREIIVRKRSERRNQKLPPAVGDNGAVAD